MGRDPGLRRDDEKEDGTRHQNAQTCPLDNCRLRKTAIPLWAARAGLALRMIAPVPERA
jgi:hypothetical protein